MFGLNTGFRRGLDQDWVDRANGFWTVLLLAVCSVGAFLVRYTTTPISCVTPVQFSESMNLFTMETCFKQELVYLPLEDIIPRDSGKRKIMSYHLWIPFILFIQALCFKIPNIIWTTCKRYITLNLDETVDSLKQAQLTSNETRKSLFQDASKVMDSLLKRNNFILAVLYLVVKLLFCLNLLGQFVFVTIYFRNALLIKPLSYVSLDLEAIIKPLLVNRVLCDFSLLKLTNMDRYTVQCTLSIAEVYEKLYVFLWYWFFFLAIVTFFNLVLWAGFLFVPFLRDGKISAYIKASGRSSPDSSVITRFISGSLGIDGVFLMSMISQNSSEMVAANLSQEMYQVFLEKDRPMPFSQPETSTSETPASELRAESIPMSNVTSETGNPEKPPIV